MDSDNNTILVRDCSKLTTAEWRTHSHYVLFYINLTKNSLTGLIPLALLATMNFLVYRKLVNRRKEVEGKIATVVSESNLPISILCIPRYHYQWTHGKPIENWKSPGQNYVWRCYPIHPWTFSSRSFKCIWIGPWNPQIRGKCYGPKQREKTQCELCFKASLLANCNYFMNVKREFLYNFPSLFSL